MQSAVGRDLLEPHPSRPVLRGQRLAAALARLPANLSESHPLQQREPRAVRAIRGHRAIVRSAPSRSSRQILFRQPPPAPRQCPDERCSARNATVSDAVYLAPAQDDPRQPSPLDLRLLLSSGRSERLARWSRDEWSSSKGSASSSTLEAPAFGRNEKSRLASRPSLGLSLSLQSASGEMVARAPAGFGAAPRNPSPTSRPGCARRGHPQRVIVTSYWLTSGFIRMKPTPVAVASMKSARSAREMRERLSRPIGPAW